MNQGHLTAVCPTCKSIYQNPTEATDYFCPTCGREFTVGESRETPTPFTLRSVVHAWAPPALLALYYRLRRVRPWRGVYANQSDIAVIDGNYDNADRTREFMEQTVEALADVRAGRPLPPNKHGAFAATLTVMAAAQSMVRVVDFGGAGGWAYVVALASRRSGAIRYHVVDLPAIVAAGQKHFAGEREMSFSTEMPNDGQPIDLLYLCGILPYLPDWRTMLAAMLECRPRVVLFNQLVAGANPSFWTAQHNLPGQVLAYHILNLAEVMAVMERGGYRLVSQAEDHATVYDLSNFPPSHRFGLTKTLLFGRVHS